MSVILHNWDLKQNSIVNVRKIKGLVAPEADDEASPKSYSDTKLAKDANLSDLRNLATARGNLGAAKNGDNTDITSLQAISVGDLNANSPQLIVKGGATGADMLRLQRTSAVSITYGIGLGSGRLAFNNVTSGVTGFSLSDTELLLGEPSGTTGRSAFLGAGNVANVSNIGGSNLFLSSGLGTGTGGLSQIIFRVPIAATAGTTQQTYANGMVLSNPGNLSVINNVSSRSLTATSPNIGGATIKIETTGTPTAGSTAWGCNLELSRSGAANNWVIAQEPGYNDGLSIGLRNTPFTRHVLFGLDGKIGFGTTSTLNAKYQFSGGGFVISSSSAPQLDPGSGNFLVTGTGTINDWKKINLTSTGLADFVHFVILLHPRYSTTSLALNYCKGIFYLSRGNTTAGNIYCAIEVDTQSVQNANFGTLTYKNASNSANGNYNFELCTCTYQGIEWLGIRTTMPSTTFSSLANTANFSFEGLHRVSAGSQFALNIIGYYNTSAATAVDPEINSSITAFVPNIPTIIQSPLVATNGILRTLGTDGSYTNIYNNTGGTTALLEHDLVPSATATAAIARYFRFTNTTIPLSLEIQKGNNTNTLNHRLGANQNSFLCADNGNLGIGIPVTNTINPKLHVAGGVAITPNGAVTLDPGAGNLKVVGQTATSGLKVGTRIVTANTTITTAECLVFINASANPIDLTLPTAIGNLGVIFTLIRTDNSANLVRVLTNPNTQTINANATAAIPANSSINLSSNDANWFVF